jgi:hypothetical protein
VLALALLAVLTGSDKLAVGLTAAAWMLTAIPATVAALHAHTAVTQAKPPSNSVTNGWYAENTYFLMHDLVDLWRLQLGLPPVELPGGAEGWGRRVGDSGEHDDKEP